VDRQGIVSDTLIEAATLCLVAVFISVPALVAFLVMRWVRRFGADRAAVAGLVLAAVTAVSPLPEAAAGMLYFAAPPMRLPLASLDLALSKPAREAAIILALRDQLAPDRRGGYQLPAGATGLSVYGSLQILPSPCGPRFFFLTLTGFSPDPYAGLEFVPEGCQPEVDPLGSGQGTADSLGDGWFWIEAS
jgi:hypothetical protein